ncbi:hypothetical protein BN8_03153 [Fibrisoma limi BUZ 3]|uniref:Nucleotidyltransferase family protein n=1 Tax=Fibrisoma limi BUZ 3 TaxID=1185876 RepID=I2GJE0_9BACT|nr:nucleotidyltransferase family protein [Fibrisoma limi]CCH54015.1 hypothetical protein BN8_03153 [Fibrisoma limi BUZ 3]
MEPGNSLELTLLLSSCTLNPTPERTGELTNLLKQDVDWSRLSLLADRHRVTPFLYRAFQELPGIPKPFLNDLHKVCQILATDNMIKLHEYRQVATLLANNKIDHIAYKGIDLAANHYPSSALRICGDIDILVNEVDAGKAIKLLQEHHYKLSPKHLRYWQQGERSLLTDLYEVSLFKPVLGNHIDIDLHWTIVCFNKDFNAFRLSDFRTEHTHQTELELILLVMHHGVFNIWQRIYYVNDLYFLLQNKVVDWPWLLHRLRAYGLEKTFLVGLLWCRQLWNIQLPTSVLESIEQPSLTTLARNYEKNWESINDIEFSDLVFNQLKFFLKSQSDPKKIVKIIYTFLTSRLFRASTFVVGKRLFFIPKELGFVTIFLRALRSLYRFYPTRH